MTSSCSYKSKSIQIQKEINREINQATQISYDPPVAKPDNTQIDQTPIKLKSQIYSEIKSNCLDFRIDQPDQIELFPMTFVPDSIQSLETCYAHAAAKLYDSWLISKNFKNKNFNYTPTSPSHISYLTQLGKSNHETSLSYGHIEDALTALKNKSVCQIQKGDFNFSKVIEEKTEKAMQAADFFLIDHKFDFQKDDFNHSILIEKLIKIINWEFQFKFLNLKDDQEKIIKFFKSKNVLQFFESKNIFSCSNINLIDFNFKVKFYGQPSQPAFKMNLFRDINQKFKNKSFRQQPLAVDYCSGPFLKRNQFADCHAHSAVIIGQRFNKETNHCQYLVTDSSLPKGIKTSHIEADNPEVGQKFWINISDFLTYSYKMTFIEN